MERRDFSRTSAVGVGVAIAPAVAGGAPTPSTPADLARVTDAGERRGDMLYRKLGRTGELVSLIGMGGEADPRGARSRDHVSRQLRDYGHGNSEMWMGAALALRDEPAGVGGDHRDR